MEMEKLISVVNKVQDTFSTAGIMNPIDLPQIAVIGSQSSGKSSVLENLVGRNFLPRGSGIVTRRPLVLQLVNTSEEKNNVEYGIFLHRPNERFTDFDKIRNEIIADTERVTGGNLGISQKPISLQIFSPNVTNLTLVDLPGITKVPVGNQPKDIERQIRDMVMQYICKPNSIILSVNAANSDIANSDGLKLAREVDPDGARTFGVLTKIDLMDKGTDVVDILQGKVIPLRYGYVPVVNRGQMDVAKKIDVQESLRKEEEFFANHEAYRSKASYCGTRFLAKKLSGMLMRHIRSTLPDIKAKIQQNLKKYSTELATMGGVDNSNDPSRKILFTISEYCNDIREHLEGKNYTSPTTELTGGARISYIFTRHLSGLLERIDPIEQLTDSAIQTLIYNSAGIGSSLFVASYAFEVLVKLQISRLEEPSLACVSLVYEELVKITLNAQNRPVFKMYPAFRDLISTVTVDFLKKNVEPTKTLISKMIKAHKSFINGSHPDFVVPQTPVLRTIDEMGPKVGGQPGMHPSQPGFRPPPPSGPQRNDDRSRRDDKVQVQNTAQIPTTIKPTGPISDREKSEITMIKQLTSNYFAIIKKNVSDMVPKYIICYLVDTVREELQNSIVQEVYTRDQTELFSEAAETKKHREDCIKMVIALKKSEAVLAQLDNITDI